MPLLIVDLTVVTSAPLARQSQARHTDTPEFRGCKKKAPPSIQGTYTYILREVIQNPYAVLLYYFEVSHTACTDTFLWDPPSPS